MHTYLKLRNGTWILVTKKIEQTTTSSKKRVTRYILAGITVNGPPKLPSEESVKVPANIVNKVISKLLEVEDNAVAIVEPLDNNHYIIRVPRGKGNVVKLVFSEIAERRKKSLVKGGKETS